MNLLSQEVKAIELSSGSNPATKRKHLMAAREIRHVVIPLLVPIKIFSFHVALKQGPAWPLIKGRSLRTFG